MRHIVCLYILLGLFSCNFHQTSDTRTITINPSDQDQEIPLSRFISSCQFIPLETQEDCMLGEIDKIEQKNGELYVLDRSNNMICEFSMDGKHHRTLFQVGNGPGEYFQLMDFDIEGDTLYVLDFASQRVLMYDLQFQYIKEFKYKMFSTQLAAYHDRIYLYNLKSKKGVDHKFSVYDSSGEKVGDYVERPDHANLQNYNECSVFIKTGSQLYLSPVYGNLIYACDSIEPVYQVHFTGKSFPNDRNIEEESIFSPDFPYLVKNNCFLSERFGLLDYFSHQVRISCVWDRTQNHVETGIIQNDLVPHYRFFPRWGNEDYLLEEISPSLLRESFSELVNKIPILNSINEDDNPVLVLYKWKE